MFNPALYLGDFRTVQGESRFSGSVNLLVPADPNRVYLAANNTNGNICYVSPDASFTPPAAPWTIPFEFTFELWWERHGLLVTLPLYFASRSPLPIGGVVVSWLSLRFQPTS